LADYKHLVEEEQLRRRKVEGLVVDMYRLLEERDVDAGVLGRIREMVCAVDGVEGGLLGRELRRGT
jgi:hypothetical protein